MDIQEETMEVPRAQQWYKGHKLKRAVMSAKQDETLRDSQVDAEDGDQKVNS